MNAVSNVNAVISSAKLGLHGVCHKGYCFWFFFFAICKISVRSELSSSAKGDSCQEMEQ